MDSNYDLNNPDYQYKKAVKNYEKMLADATRNSIYSRLRNTARKANIESSKIKANDRLYLRSPSKASISRNRLESSSYYIGNKYNEEFTKSMKKINPKKKIIRDIRTIIEEEPKSFSHSNKSDKDKKKRYN